MLPQDQDSVKEAFLETNIYLLALTFVISIVHSVFEFLAFKNDIQFWNNRFISCAKLVSFSLFFAKPHFLDSAPNFFWYTHHI